jgi:murein DD-endopeptidase MepM/ murein hydrolase activator NlpD
MKVWSILGGAVTVLLLTAAMLFFILTGPQDLSQFPPREESPYLLPWPEGIDYFCVQGVRGVVSHRGASQFAYDFYMPIGSDICAARAGKVVKVVQHYDGNGRNWPNNVVLVDHGDGTRACYAHIKQDGSYVAEGDTVEQRQVIAASGNVGNSMMPHLHFHITDTEVGRTIPISFRDVKKDKGVPRMFKWYASGKQDM